MTRIPLVLTGPLAWSSSSLLLRTTTVVAALSHRGASGSWSKVSSMNGAARISICSCSREAIASARASTSRATSCAVLSGTSNPISLIVMLRMRCGWSATLGRLPCGCLDLLGSERSALSAVVLRTVTEVDDDQAGVLDTGVAGGDGPVLAGLGWVGRADLVDAGLQVRTCLLKQPGMLACQGQRRPADSLREPLLDPVGLVEQPLQRTKFVLLLLGVVAELADQQGSARGKGWGDVHAQVHRADGGVAFEHDRLRGVFHQVCGVEVVGGQITRREGEQPGRACAGGAVAAQFRVSCRAGLPRPAQRGVASAAHGKHPVLVAGHQPLDEGGLARARRAVHPDERALDHRRACWAATAASARLAWSMSKRWGSKSPALSSPGHAS